ncbi:hypothetical protein CUJ83_02315 [Methanocella sp. CWC-04]|uniref:Gins51 C-terminal domain-containing protein n=1 Tax=Methanooceanicella nereidis TaxID=2052831 RepID=A0AAP2W689_9EURY|nr:hypothetical protein [Methanocella sp. CWC-04]MCD1293831.1 hypothetical protein [Methanocella sp. CWC-04]
MNLEELARILTVERESDKLQDIEDSFYEECARYIRQLEQDKAEAANYKEASMIDDEIKNARIIIEGVFDRRVSKILEYASISASGTRLSAEGLTSKEKSLYESLVSALERGRSEILIPILELPSRSNPGKNILGGTTTKEKPIEKSLTHDSDLKEEVMMVKVLKDIPRFVGVDGRHYQLSEEDVVVLPKANALVLCNKNVAIPLQNQ